MTKQVLIILGSESDQPVADDTIALLDKLGISYQIRVSSAHRHPDRTADLSRKAEEDGFSVVICIAGMAAHLAGVVASHTNLPVIGVPVPASLAGMDSLLSMVQMPPGIPVATMAVGKAGAKNAAVLAARILGLVDREIAKKHGEYRNSL
jgi:phosphoribosylaminoimidazole carboxylase PurE protein